MRKLSLCVLMAAVLMVAGAADASVAVNAVAKGKAEREVTCEGAAGCVRDLVAGQHTVVGSVSVAQEQGVLVVTYDTTGSDWWITEIHFEVSDEPIANSAPGRFDYKPYLDGPTQFFQFELSESCNDFDGVPYYAAHAVVGQYETVTRTPDLSNPENLGLPQTATMSVQFTDGSAASYFAGTVNGESFETWCVDLTRTIPSGTEFEAVVLSSYQDLPEGYVQVPENLPKVNWILNNRNYLNEKCSAGMTDIQGAIWKLVSTPETFTGSGCDDGRCGSISFLPETVLCIIAEAEAFELANEPFVPDCSQEVAVILAPVATGGEAQQSLIAIAQVTAITTEIACEEELFFTGNEETAWACGDFIRPGKNWAMYFQCNACIEAQ